MRSSCLALAALACTLVAPTVAHASSSGATTTASPATEATEATPTEAQPTRKDRPRVRAIEIQALGMGELLPRPAGGGDVAFVLGHPNFQVRLGAMFLGVPKIKLGAGEVTNLLATSALDLCAAKGVLRHQIRMCIGGQLGGMFHRWQGFDTPQRRATPWGAGTMRGDYQIKLTEHFGVMGGVGVVLPVLGPSFRGETALGTKTPTIFPGPMSGFLSVGTTFRW